MASSETMTGSLAECFAVVIPYAIDLQEEAYLGAFDDVIGLLIRAEEYEAVRAVAAEKLRMAALIAREKQRK